MGWPVAHSLSPALHNAWFARHGIDGAYIPLPVRPEDLEQAFRTLPRLGFLGWNVTLPHKEAAFRLVDDCDPAARRMGAVNTVLVRPDGRAPRELRPLPATYLHGSLHHRRRRGGEDGHRDPPGALEEEQPPHQHDDHQRPVAGEPDRTSQTYSGLGQDAGDGHGTEDPQPRRDQGDAQQSVGAREPEQADSG